MKEALIISSSDAELCELSKHLEGRFSLSHEKELSPVVASTQQRQFDIIFVELTVLEVEYERLGDKCYLTSLQTLWKKFPGAKVILISNKSKLRSVVRAVRAGADDYIILPSETEEIDLVLEKVDDYHLQEAQIIHFQKALSDRSSTRIIKTSSNSMKEVFQKVLSVSDKTANVLLTGETGVGKGVIARLLHENSNRKDGPFIAVHCGAIHENLIESELFGHEKGAFTGAIKRKLGRFELASGGTIFLDEISTISPSVQIKLLQVLQESFIQRVGGEEDVPIDIRIISAANEDLKELSEKGVFRKDLFYRLNVFPIEIPALRDRMEDLPELLDHFIQKFSRHHQKELLSVGPDIIDALSKYSWPGNIRELENLVERACILENTTRLQLTSFPIEVVGTSSSEQIVSIDSHLPLAEARNRVIENFEKKYLIDLMSKSEGKIKNVAKDAEIGIRQVHKLLTKYGLLGREFRKNNSKTEKNKNSNSKSIH